MARCHPTRTYPIDARIQQHASSTNYADLLAAEGITTVTMNVDGTLVSRSPDGTRSPIG